MNDQSQNRLHHHWLGWIAMLAFASILSPINIHIVIAQELPPIVVAPADPGEPPAPPQAPATPAVAIEVPTSAAEALSDPVAEPTVPAPAVAAPTVLDPVAAGVPAQSPDVPAAPSEVSSDTDIGKLLPNDEAVAPVSEESQADSKSVRTLSVEPGVRPMLPKDRPAWVGATPDFTSPQHFLYVGSLPTTNQLEADDALDVPLIAAVRNYIDQEVVNQVGAANSMPVTAEFIRRNLIDNPEGYECELTTGQDPLFQKWVTVRVTPEQRELFRQWHTEATQRTRLAPLGIGLVAVLSVISLSHVVLRRFRGASPLTNVVQHLPEQVVSRKTRNWSTPARLLLFVLLMSAVLFAFLLPLFAIRQVKSARVVGPRTSHSVNMTDLHNDVRIETLDGSERIIILESKNDR